MIEWAIKASFIGFGGQGVSSEAHLPGHSALINEVSMLDRVQSWFSGKDLSTDWLTGKLPYWFMALEKFEARQVSVLEVGAFEGRSTIAFLEMLPQARVTAIDVFPDDTEAKFDKNTEPYGERCRKYNGRALGILDRMNGQDRKFHVIYLDASKKRQNVLALSVAAWPLLRINGIMIWDDFKWKPDKDDAERPESAIKLFCEAFAPCLTILHNDKQMMIRKDAEWPQNTTPG